MRSISFSIFQQLSIIFKHFQIKRSVRNLYRRFIAMKLLPNEQNKKKKKKKEEGGKISECIFTSSWYWVTVWHTQLQIGVLQVQVRNFSYAS